jgi:RNA polymerase sigma factor (sigma-70 family)
LRNAQQRAARDGSPLYRGASSGDRADTADAPPGAGRAQRAAPRDQGCPTDLTAASRANFGTWLHRIAVNCSIDLIRARPRRETSHDVADLEVMNAPPVTSKAVEASPERLMLSAEVQERISSAMTSLSQMERAAFVLRHFEGHSIEEISRTLGLKVNAAKHSIFRAVKKMRVALEPFVPTE